MNRAPVAERPHNITDVRNTEPGGNYCCGSDRGYVVWRTRRFDILVCRSCHAEWGTTRGSFFGSSPLFGDVQ